MKRFFLRLLEGAVIKFHYDVLLHMREKKFSTVYTRFFFLSSFFHHTSIKEREKKLITAHLALVKVQTIPFSCLFFCLPAVAPEISVFFCASELLIFEFIALQSIRKIFDPEFPCLRGRKISSSSSNQRFFGGESISQRMKMKGRGE